MINSQEKPIVTKSSLKHAIGGVGLLPGDVVAFHASLSAFGVVDGGADALIDAILETVGPRGTALAPTLTFAEKYGPDCAPVFDARSTPSVTGRTPEVFRMRAAAVRSLHPTHSWTAIGPRAAEYTAGHEDCVTPCGGESPVGRLARDPRGKVLMLGVGLKACTFFHYCEETAGVPYHLQPRVTRCAITDVNGRTIERDLLLHRWGGEPRDFTRPERDLLRLGIMRKTVCGDGEIRLLCAHSTADFLVDNLRRNPHYLLA